MRGLLQKLIALIVDFADRVQFRFIALLLELCRLTLELLELLRALGHRIQCRFAASLVGLRRVELLIQILRLRLRQRLVRFEQLLLQPLDILLGVGVSLLHAVVRAEEPGANALRLFLARMQIAPLGGCLRIRQHLL